MQISLNQQSQQVFVPNIHSGLKFLHLPFGSASTPAIFQRYLEQLTISVPAYSNYLDDIVVSRCTLEEVLLQAGLKCNRNKVVLFQ